jgi:glycogen debranching enzyme
MSARLFSVVDGATFVVGDARGDLLAAPGSMHGFFHDDTRFLSRWQLTLDGEALESLTVADGDYFALDFFLTRARGSARETPTLAIARRRIVRGSWIEELEIANHGRESVTVELALEADCDFADLFELGEDEVRSRSVSRQAGGEELLLVYRRDALTRTTRISARGGCKAGEHGFSARLTLAPGEERRVAFEIRPGERQAGAAFAATRTELRRELETWLADAPALECDWEPLTRTYLQSLADLAALRLPVDGKCVPAAGLPWFMALFGRDSLIASYQALPVCPDLARSTLLALAARQAVHHDDFRDAEPGKILHELRHGELTLRGERPHSPYFGTVDATPLFLVLLDEYERWSGDAELVGALEPNARAALAWIDAHGDLDGVGYVEYRRRHNDTGLANQCWKDSPDSMLFADGRAAEPPIACCEVQGYVFDAKRRCARLAREIWGDTELAGRLEDEADALRRRFEADFWLEERGHYALALDGEKRAVDSITSNVGHLLWSGIVSEERAARLAEVLMDEPLFSGWGVRTLARGEAGYNPLAYHNGSVWPHDNSLIAAGLARYGHRAEAARIAVAMLEAAEHFEGRLPELFAGHPRALTGVPVPYPAASRPQAWATAAPLLLVRILLGIEPNGAGLAADPWLPEQIGRLAVREVPGRWGRADIVA